MIRSLFRLTILVLLLGSSWAALKAADTPGSFPHETHDGLFPTCNACHAGLFEDGTGEAFSVTPDDCAGCHDGDTADPVDWSGTSTRRPVNLEFDHSLHTDLECGHCHRVEGAERFEISLPAPELCMDCHEAEEHLVDAECATCHTPWAEVPWLTAARVAAFPRPADHDDPDFIRRHGQDINADRCAACHARETCDRCHLNAASIEAVAGLASDERADLQAQGIESRWPLPESHADPDWLTDHGAGESLQSCANCHVRDSCSGCHAEIPAAGIEFLPVAAPGGPPGIELLDAFPPGHTPEFYRDHAVAATTGPETCMTCHSPSTCENCHSGAGQSGFHSANYMMRHAAEAYARDTDCSSCHSTETFCRACHENTGQSASASRSSSFHDAQPLWLLSHGNAARQGLDNCASCHQQNDCLPCHSAKTGWRINPHGPGFDPNGTGDRNIALCATCHFADPRPE